MTPINTQRPVVRLQRTISAPPERVYQAWLEPELLQRWMAPESMQVARVEVDERIGGHVTLRDAAGVDTELTLVHEHLDALERAMPEVAEGVEPGWDAVLDKLAKTVEQASS
jgi:uncharacterized protein YndB with AHSA1/START domain